MSHCRGRHDCVQWPVNEGQGERQDASLVLLISKHQQVCPGLSLDVTNLVYQEEHLDPIDRTQV